MIAYAAQEARSPHPGGKGLLAKLAEVVFVEMLRMHMRSQSAATEGWLAGLSDRIVGAALNALHADPARDWTLASLARHVGTSRSVLAGRFQQLVGTTTMQYLTQWRVLLAANLLSHSKNTMLQITEEVGYDTDTAFSRAFRREFGMPPATWRRHQSLPAETTENAWQQ